MYLELVFLDLCTVSARSNGKNSMLAYVMTTEDKVWYGIAFGIIIVAAIAYIRINCRSLTPANDLLSILRNHGKLRTWCAFETLANTLYSPVILEHMPPDEHHKQAQELQAAYQQLCEGLDVDVIEEMEKTLPWQLTHPERHYARSSL